MERFELDVVQPLEVDGARAADAVAAVDERVTALDPPCTNHRPRPSDAYPQDVVEGDLFDPLQAVQQVGVPLLGPGRESANLVLLEPARGGLMDRTDDGFLLANTVSFSQQGEGVLILRVQSQGHRHQPKVPTW